MRQQGVLLPRDGPTLPPGHARVFALAELVERVAQMA